MCLVTCVVVVVRIIIYLCTIHPINYNLCWQFCPFAGRCTSWWFAELSATSRLCLLAACERVALDVDLVQSDWIRRCRWVLADLLFVHCALCQTFSRVALKQFRSLGFCCCQRSSLYACMVWNLWNFFSSLFCLYERVKALLLRSSTAVARLSCRKPSCTSFLKVAVRSI